MGISCPNRNSSEYKAINEKYNDDLTTSMLIIAWQQLNNSKDIPKLSTLESDFKDAEVIFESESRGFSQDIIKNLESLELIKKDGNNYVLVEDLEKIEAYLSFQNINPGIVIIQDGKFFLNKAFYNLEMVSKKSRPNKESTHIKPLVEHMNRIFPGVKIEMVSEEKAKKYYDSLQPQQKAKIKFSEMNSFYIDGKAYLIEERITDDILVEEVLHPFIDVIKSQEHRLFARLLSESKVLFPELNEDINNTYTSKRGFTQTDRDLELVTQGLSMLFNKEFKTEVTPEYTSLFQKVLKWLFNLVNKLNSYLTGKEINEPGFITDNITELVSTAYSFEKDGLGGGRYVKNLSGIAKMLNRKDLRFINNMTIDLGKVKYSFSPEKKATYDHAKGMGNPLQVNLMEKIFHKPLNSKEVVDELTVSIEDDGMPMVMRDKDHVYKDLFTGKEFRSTTNVINGTVGQMKGYEINRDIGNDFDLIADMIAGGKLNNVSELAKMQDKFKVLNLEQSQKALSELVAMTKELMDEGTILIPQVIVYDESTGIAGTIDLLGITPEGKIKIIDLKTSIHSKNGNVYKYAKLNLADDSLVKTNVIDPAGTIEKLTRKQKHALQVNLYKRMLENMGLPVDYSDNAAITYHMKIDMEGKGADQVYKGTFDNEGIEIHPYKENDYIIDQLIPLNVNALSQEKIEEIYGESEEAILDGIEAVDDDVNTEEVNMEGTEKQSIYELEDLPPEFDIITGALETHQAGLISKLDAIEKVKSNIFMDKDVDLLKAGIVNDITEITIALSDTPEERSRLYTQLMMGALDQIKKFESYVKDPKNFNKPEFITYVLNFDRFLSTFEGLFKLTKEGNLNKTQTKLAFQLQTRAVNLMGSRNQEGIIDAAIVNFVRDIVKTKSSRNFTDAELDMLMKQANDIGIAERSVQDIATSSDTLLAVMDKIFKAKKQEMIDIVSLKEIRIKDVASRLIKLSDSNDVNEIYDFMLEFDENGEFSGRYTNIIGPVYYTKLLELREPLFDADGRPLQYRDVTDLDNASQEDINYNIDLANKKKIFSEFFAATTIGANNQPVDGKYHKYTTEFKKARGKHEVFIPVGKNGYWEKRSDVSSKAYKLYKLKYFEKNDQGNNIYAEQIDGKYTGQIVKDNVFMYVKQKHRLIKEDSIIDGKSVVNPKYKAIMENETALGKVQKEFFDMWTQIYEKDLLNKIPRAQRDQMMGHTPLVRGRMTKSLRGKDPLHVTMFGKMAQGTKEFFTSTSEQRVMVADERGQLVDHLPIMYTGRAKSQSQLDAIDAELEGLKDRARLPRENENWIGTDSYNEQVQLLKGKRKRIESRPFKNEISRDLATSLLKFTGTVQYFDTMNTVDDTLKAMMKVISDRTYQPSKGKQLTTGIYNTISGKSEFKAVGKSGMESRARERGRKWLEMVFYNTDEISKTVVDKMAASIMNLSSLAYVGLNPFGNLNNYVFGRIMDNLEAVGGRYYSARSLARANVEYNKRAIPAMIQRIAGGATKGAAQQYDPDKPNNKYEALVDLFRMMDDSADIREMTKDKGEKSWFAKKFQIAFVLQDAAEWNVQTKVGIAILMDTQIRKSSDGPGGKAVSLYDAFEFDKNTNGVKLKEGYDTIVEFNPKNLDKDGNPSVYYERKYTDEYRYELRNKIREVNKQVHGNYADEDRMAIQANVVGKLFAQFHKWVIPAWNARFRLEYYDENLGWMEGRYLSFFRMVGYMSSMAVQGNFKDMNAEGFQKQYEFFTDGIDMQADQKALNRVQNTYKTLGEASIIFLTYMMSLLFQSMFSGDDDDSELEARAENLLMYQTDRLWKELITFVPLIGLQQQYQMVKSPIASTRTMGELGQALAKTIETPLALMGGAEQTNSGIYYQRGSRKGQLKLTKEWMDAIPVLYAIKKYQNLAEEQTFYIK